MKMNLYTMVYFPCGSVYRLSTLAYDLRKDFKLDTAITTFWNEANYVFAGYQANAKIIVAIPSRPGRELLMVDVDAPFIYRKEE